MYFFTALLPTCFGRYSGHLQGAVLITKIQLLLTVPPLLHNNYNYIIWVKVI